MPRLRARNQLTSASNTPSPGISTRPRRAASSANRQEEDTITVARSESPSEHRKSTRLTIKMPANKLREATTRRAKTLAERESFSPGEVVRGKRSTRAAKPIIDSESGSDEEIQQDEDDEVEEEEEEEEVEQDDDLDAEGEDDLDDADGEPDPDAEGDSEMDAEGEEDYEMLEAPPTVKITQHAEEKPSGRRAAPHKPPANQSPKLTGRMKTVEEKQMEMGSDDEELSELSDEGDLDAEGEEVDEDEEMADGSEEDALGDSDPDLSGPSGTGTPDPTRLTQRQRKSTEKEFLALSMEAQVKKHLTEEERVMRRTELARRRKNLSEKRNEEEKMETINRLLKKQAPKRRGKISAAEIAEGAADTPEIEHTEPEHVNPVYSRWVSTKDGMVLALPGQWKDTPMGALAGNKQWRMVEELEG